jgi:hypothetical protein
MMSLSAQELNRLRRLVSIAQKLILEETKPKRGRPVGSNGHQAKRVRRTGKKLVEFRKMLKAERKKGVPVAALARKHKVSPAYIYLL